MKAEELIEQVKKEKSAKEEALKLNKIVNGDVYELSLN